LQLADHGNAPVCVFCGKTGLAASCSHDPRGVEPAVQFDDACSDHFKWEGDFWDCVVRAVAQAAKKHPHYLDATYRDARNNLAYLMK